MHPTCTTQDESWLGAERGFTLIELVVVVLVLSVVVGMTATLTIKPLEAYGDVRLRTALTDSAEAATRRIRRDIRSALPNSVRVSGDGLKLELIHVVDGRGTEPKPARILPRLRQTTPPTRTGSTSPSKTGASTFWGVSSSSASGTVSPLPRDTGSRSIPPRHPPTPMRRARSHLPA